METGRLRSEEVLYRDDLAKVSPAWLTNEATSYAIRTMVRLTFIERAAPPIRSLLLFFFCIALIFVSCYYLVREVVPAGVAWGLLISSILLWLFSIWYAFLKKPLFLIKAAFLDGTVVNILRQKRSQATGLYTALNKAMNWHIGSDDQFEDYVIDQEHKADTARVVAQEQEEKKQRRIRSMLALLFQRSK